MPRVVRRYIPVDRKPAQGPPRCCTCGYVLESLAPSGPCPECGRPYALDDEQTFTRKPPFHRARFWMPAAVMAATISIVSLLAIGVGLGNNGFAAWVGVPMAGGAVLGYRFRAGGAAGVIALITAALALVAAILFSAVSMSLAGVFCALVLSVALVGPILLGLVAGVLLRGALKSSKWDQRWYLPLAAVALPVGWALLEGPPAHGLETVSTSVVVPASPETCYDAMAFYEEVRHTPPLLLRIGLAHPLGALGASRAPGDVKKCLYNKGHITKQVTEASRGRKLAFVVIDQKIGYEHDVRLVDGAFLFEAVDGGTRITAVTRYEPLIAPRILWRWGEAWAIRTLHGHVLEGLRRRATGEAS